MTLYAQTIVDVPTMQTNQPYTYVIPEELQALIVPGVRISVPFGKGSRTVLGYVVGVTEELPEQVTQAMVKPVQTVLDLTPVLSDEMIELSAVLAEKTLAFRISILQTMLPNALKASYSKQISISDSADLKTEWGEHFFAGNETVDLAEHALSLSELKQLKTLEQAHKISISTLVGDKKAVKTETIVQPLLSVDVYQAAQRDLRANTQQLYKLLDVLIELTDQNQTLSTKILKNEYAITSATVNKGMQNGWLTKTEQEVYRDPFGGELVEQSHNFQLNDEQRAAYQQIKPQVEQSNAVTFLLEGITGSGKTEVYLQAMQTARVQQRDVLFLVPEISLTPQTVGRIRSRFAEPVAVLHSALSDGERYDEWRRIERGEAHIVIGARSAVFAPLKNIGLIVMDEEHETTYKQSDNPRYHARDVVLWRSQFAHAPVILGSATPSLESKARAQRGVYQQLTLTQRANQQASLPTVKVVDLKDEIKSGPESAFSQELRSAIEQRLAEGEQSVLMLNRRGYSSFVMCRDCGYVPKDPNCDIPLTMHLDTHTMKCHYCGHEEAIPSICPQCGSKRISYYGTGTQKVEEEIHQVFPTARVLRVDQDTTRRKGSLEKLLAQFEAGEADILLGTQMIAKGLDYPNVTLVGVLNADTALGLPDFHASEKTFQLLVQVSGRAGRAEKPGEVVIQTYNPDHYAIQYAQQNDYEGFYRKEMSIRHAGNYSPYYYTMLVSVSHADQRQSAAAMSAVTNTLREHLDDQTIMLGPSPRPLAKLRGKYYYQSIIKYKNDQQLDHALSQLQEELQKQVANGLRFIIDREPVSFI